jgi:hypothetical protein
MINFFSEQEAGVLVKSIRKHGYNTGLEKTQVLLKKPAGRLNAGFFYRFFRKNRFF